MLVPRPADVRRPIVFGTATKTNETLVSTTTSSRRTIAPNGSSEGVEYWTTEVYRQDWLDVPENGLYAGRSYRLTRSYVSCHERERGHFYGSSSDVWTGDDDT